MNYRLTFAQVVESLRGAGLRHEVWPLQNGVRLVITERGARALGPFLAEDAESLYWLNEPLARAESLRAYAAEGGWNLGGERIWIAPELQYNIGSRADFHGTYHLPAAMDPGTYTLDAPAAGEWRLRQQMTLTARSLASGEKTLDLEIRFRLAADPLRLLKAYEALRAGVTYAGYEQIVTLSETESNAITSGSWNLIQLNPGGQVIIPASPRLQTTVYRGDVPASVHTLHHGDHLRVDITGDNEFKVGYKAAHVTGRMAYFNTLAGGSAYLLVRSFYNNPSAAYIEEPVHLPGPSGDSIHLYNDSGAIGGFGEMECQGQPIGGDSGRAASTDSFMLWLYAGAPDRLRAIGEHLLGVRF